MNRKVLQTIETYGMLSPKDSVLIGFSGGADSSALLEFFCQNQKTLSLDRIIAVHINHCLRGEESIRDENFVRQRCEQLGIPCIVKRIDVAALAKEQNCSLETCGRMVRYEQFESVCREYGFNKIATAHTLSDHTETVLMHLLRGSGVNGMCGIPPIRGNIIRPLISCTRQEIEAYLEASKQPYLTDSSNLTGEFLRNRIRLNVIPLLKAENPSFEQAVLRFTDILKAEDDYMSQQAQKTIASMRVQDGQYDVSDFSALHSAIQMRIVWILASQEMSRAPDDKKVRELCGMMQAGVGKIQLEADTMVYVQQKKLYFYHRTQQESIPFSAPVCSGTIMTPQGDLFECTLITKDQWNNFKKVHKNLLKTTLDYDKIIENPVFRFKQAGDRIRLCGRGGTKTLKKLFSQQAIPLPLRASVPLIADEQGVVWIDGLGCDERVQIDEDTNTILWIKKHIKARGFKNEE